MPSPFPGMNPYLEQNDTWQEFHNSFIIHAQAALTRQVGPNYIVKVEVRLILHELSAEERRFMGTSDLGVSTRTSRRGCGDGHLNVGGRSSCGCQRWKWSDISPSKSATGAIAAW